MPASCADPLIANEAIDQLRIAGYRVCAVLAFGAGHLAVTRPID